MGSWLFHASVTTRDGLDVIVVEPKAWSIVTENSLLDHR